MNRRSALEAISALLGATLVSSQPVAASALVRGPSGFAIPEFRSEAGRRSASVLGHRYLEMFPNEESISRLSTLLFGEDLERHPANATWAALNAKVRTDFETSNIVKIDGWVLARSECRFCALVALVDQPSPVSP